MGQDVYTPADSLSITQLQRSSHETAMNSRAVVISGPL
jgi:hypothetical protein